MDIYEKHYVLSTMIDRIDKSGIAQRLDYYKALAKRFPDSFRVNDTSRLLVTPSWQEVPDKVILILKKVLMDTGNQAGNGGFFSIANFWDGLVQDQRTIADRALEAITSKVGILNPEDITGVHSSENWDDIIVTIKGRGAVIIKLRTLRKILRKDHYQAIKRGWTNHYGPLYNWL